jgi:hypothetical protein
MDARSVSPVIRQAYAPYRNDSGGFRRRRECGNDARAAGRPGFHAALAATGTVQHVVRIVAGLWLLTRVLVGSLRLELETDEDLSFQRSNDRGDPARLISWRP